MVKNLFLFLIIFAVSLSFAYAQKTPADQGIDLSGEAKQAYLLLLKTEKFSIGATVYVGMRSGEENALYILLKNKKAVGALENLLADAVPEGKLYALLGLKLKDKTAYQRALSDLKFHYAPPKRKSFWGIREIKKDGNGNTSIDDVAEGTIPEGMVVTDIGDLTKLKKWADVVQNIEIGTYDKAMKKR